MPVSSFLDELTGFAWGRSVSARSEDGFPGRGAVNAIFNRPDAGEVDTPSPAWDREAFPGQGNPVFLRGEGEDEDTEESGSEGGPAWDREEFPGQGNPVFERQQEGGEPSASEEDGCQKGPAWLREILEEGCDFKGPPFVGSSGQFPFNTNAFPFDGDLPSSVNAGEPQGVPFVNEDWLPGFAKLGTFSSQGRGNGVPFKG